MATNDPITLTTAKAARALGLAPGTLAKLLADRRRSGKRQRR